MTKEEFDAMVRSWAMTPSIIIPGIANVAAHNGEFARRIKAIEDAQNACRSYAVAVHRHERECNPIYN